MRKRTVVFSGRHVQATHVAELLDLAASHEPLDGERAEGAVVSSERQDERRGNGLGVHAALESAARLRRQ